MKANASSARTSERIAATGAIGGVRAATDSAPDHADRLPGSLLRLRVQQVMPDGSLQAQIDGKPVFLRLPGANVRAGMLLELEVTGTTPRLTYALRGIVREADAPSLSSTARLLAGIPGTALTDSDGATVTGTRPIVAGSPGEVATLAEALKRSITQSGIFYESHLAQWLAGSRAREDLRAEPQARLASANSQSTIQAPGAHGKDEVQAAGDNVLPGEARVIHPEALSVVQQQLIALDSGRLNWRGEVWPGQILEWQVARDGNGKHRDQFQPWHTRLRLTLPNLGAVEATISHGPSGIAVQVKAADRSAADALSADAHALARSMHGSGLNVSSVDIAHANG